MKIMVTGSEGFIGSHLMRNLEARGHEMVGVDREIDVAKMESIGAAMNDARPDTVIHCAAIAGVAECERDRATAFQTNVIGTFTVAGAAAAFGVKRFIHFSTGGHMYGSLRISSAIDQLASVNDQPFEEESPLAPPSFYGETKRISETALDAVAGSEMRTIILRPSNVYGPGGRGAIEKIAEAMMESEAVHVTGNGHQSRDYVHIDDVTRLVRLIVEDPTLNGLPTIYNVGTGMRHTVNDIVAALRSLTGWTGDVIHDEHRSFDPDHVALNATRALRVFDWAPRIAFEHGIETVISVRA